MSRTRLALLLALGASLAAFSAFAQVEKEESVDIAFTGQITVVDTVARTIALQGANGESLVVGVNDKTTIMSDDKKLTLDGLHKGDWVAVDADQRGATVVGTYIEVVDDPNDPGDD
jgi:ABC-type Fe3+-hydroxamate transport system substrate-binding protein